MRQTVSLLLAGMLLLAACSASGAGTIETAAVYEAPVFWLNPEIRDFYQFTRNDVKVEDYTAGPQVENIPVAI